MGGGQKRQIFLRMDYRRVAYEGGIDAFEESTYIVPQGVLGVHHTAGCSSGPPKKINGIITPTTANRPPSIYAICRIAQHVVWMPV
jgi:hypothetical protein